MKTLLTADWTDLLVATFEADKSLLQKYIPYKTELNDWNGKYYMSLLGFIFSRPVIAGIPSPFYRRFEEINLRLYVRCKNGNAWKNGVVFIKEIAPSPIIGLVAKWLYRENFICLPVKHCFTNTDTDRKTEYHWHSGREWNYLKLITTINPVEPGKSSLESFTRDHYYAYTKQSENKTREFEIEHRHWDIYPAISFDMKLDAANIYGKEFADYFQEPPCKSFLMNGSQTKVSFPLLL
jgi:uncharacterized protein